MDIQQTNFSPSPEGGQKQTFTNKPQFKMYLVFGVILALAIIGYFAYNAQQNGSSKQASPNATITLAAKGVTKEQRLAQLSEKEKATLEKKLASSLEDISKFTEQTTQADKDKEYVVLAGIQRSLGMYEEALASLGKISSEYKNPARVNLTYALIYQDLADLPKAAEYAKKSLDSDQSNQQAWVVYLETEQNLNNGEREAKYKEAIEKTDSHEDVLVSYAKFLEQIGNIQGAIEQYKRAGEVNQKKKPDFDAEITRLEAK
jgi:tetratricopeptide (TPR) repeat protein